MNPIAPWDNPDPVVMFDWKDFGGEVIFWITGGHHENFETRHGVKPASRGTVVVLSGRQAGKSFEDVLTFGRIQTQIAEKPPGAVTLCRVKSDGKSTTLDVPGGYDSNVAAAWYQGNPGVLDQLRAEAVQNFSVKSVELKAPVMAVPASMPQWQPQPAQPSQWSGQAVPPLLPTPPPPQAQPGPPQWGPMPPPAQPVPSGQVLMPNIAASPATALNATLASMYPATQPVPQSEQPPF